MRTKKFGLLVVTMLFVAACDVVIEAGPDNGGGGLTPDIGYDCRTAVANETYQPFYSTAAGPVIQTSSGYQMRVSLAGAEAAWLCNTDFSGDVLNVAYSEYG
ncbi:MAG: hypothetical protein L3J37_03250 [Rhodobacteraceae bacterium]|nr:hypothetical protein [Paracoccaceae bacterium]